MNVLGIESSCDETAASIVRDGRTLLSNVIHSQIDIHAEYGGVIPEIAARSHIEVINPVINRALSEAQLSWNDIDAIAVTYAPGLVGSLLVGSLAARTLALVKNKPLYPVHHVEAHVYANFLNQTQPTFPLLALIVSGGHSQLVLFKNHGDYQLLGQTQDDAVGEAFDKVAKIIGLPYPGGPSIARAALSGDPYAYKLPKAKLNGAYDFSFSGLKTAVLRSVQREAGVDIRFPSFKLAEKLTDSQKNDFAASFQRTAVDTLVETTLRAYDDYRPETVVIAGGVAANRLLRTTLAEKLPCQIDYAPFELCTDNAAMVASLGFYKSQVVGPCNPFTLSIVPSVSMKLTAWNQ